MNAKPITYEKVLSANDTGVTGGHMGGILIPKGDQGLIALFPPLDPAEYNPSAFINVKGPAGEDNELRFVYYNGRLHGKSTRNEYRLTYLTAFLRNQDAKTGDRFQLTKDPDGSLRMEVVHQPKQNAAGVIKLSGWKRVC